jgi:hypothetical protein
MIDPITEVLLTEIPSDSVIQNKFKSMINAETEKCEKISGTANYKKCKSLATSFAVKKFLYKYGDAPDKVVEMVQRELEKS